MSTHSDEYDDLDDYLDEPFDVEKEQGHANAEQQPRLNNNLGNKPIAAEKSTSSNAAMSKAIENLQAEFENLAAGDKSEEAKFKELLNTLGAAAAAQTCEKDGASPISANGGDFKEVVSNTLGRIKEHTNNIDSTLEEERKAQNPDAILSQLLSELVDDTAEGGEAEEGMDNAILNILNQMSSKEVMYQPMKDMQLEFTRWMELNSTKEEHREKIPIYQKQLETVGKIVAIYERADYSNDKYRDEITDLIDALEQLGDSPVSKGFSGNEATGDLEKLTRMMQVDGDENLGKLDKQLEDTCKQQ